MTIRDDAHAGRCSAHVVSRVCAAHARIDALLAEHQIALVERRYDEAVRLFADFRDRLCEHMELEERELLPVYERSGTWPAAAAPDLMRAEHEQVRSLVRAVEQLITEVDAPERLTPRVVIHLIEEERRLKGVLEHHHCRDERYLYPALGHCVHGARVGPD